jgi:hypothetical protein
VERKAISIGEMVADEKAGTFRNILPSVYALIHVMVIDTLKDKTDEETASALR